MFVYTFVIDGVFSHLLPRYYKKINDCDDLANLMQCNHRIEHLIRQKLLEVLEFNLFDVIVWINPEFKDNQPASNVDQKELTICKKRIKFEKIRRIIVDQNVTLRGKNVHPMPKYLRELSFCNEYSRPLTQLCGLSELTNLTKLTFGNNFNRLIIPGTFPESLLDLTLGSYNKQLDPNVLPKNLTKLTFGFNFNQPLSFHGVTLGLPKSLTELNFGNQFNQIINPGTFGENLQILTFGYRFNRFLIPGSLPESLLELIFPPHSVFTNGSVPIDEGALPRNLKKIKFGQEFNQPLKPGSLPDGLTHIVFGRLFNQPLNPGVLPGSLKKLKFGYNLCDNNTLFSTNSYGSQFNQPLYVRPYPGVLPDGLTHLAFSEKSSFNQPIPPGGLPKGINLIVSRDYPFLCEDPCVKIYIYTFMDGSSVCDILQKDIEIDTRHFNS